jgi:OHCU decarboxylase
MEMQQQTRDVNGRGIHVYKELFWLNHLTHDEAESAFFDCCGSHKWAARMTAARPFTMLEDLFRSAEDIWFSLGPQDWLEAFAAHPKIGSKDTSTAQQHRSANWSAGEQSGISEAEDAVLTDLKKANKLYEEKFGFIFIVCATGKSADEMLAICRARFGNSSQTEMQIAAAEQAKITEIRLTKLLER